MTPNLMVVVPTANHVTLTYGYTPIDWAGFLLSLLGFAGVIVLWRLRPVVYPTPRHLARGWSGWRAAGPSTAKVRDRMAPFDASTLSPVFKAYDIRGTVPDQINTALARAVGGAFARFAGPGRILVARDMRPRVSELTRAFAEGVTSTGTDVVDLGLTSTDELYFASGSLEAPGAMFTASHNPADYNGIKLCLSGARPVGADTGLPRDHGVHPGHEPRGLPGRSVPGRVTQATCSPPTPRRSVPLSTATPWPAEGDRRHRQRHGGIGRSGCLRRPAVPAGGPLR